MSRISTDDIKRTKERTVGVRLLGKTLQDCRFLIIDFSEGGFFMKIRTGMSIFLAIICLALLSGCVNSSGGNKPLKERDILYQVSTINSLVAGNYDGIQKVQELKANGDVGIGTFDALDGELVMIDSKVYKVKSTGEVEEIGGFESVPFAAVTFLDKDISKEISPVISFDSLKLELDKLIENKELFYAFRIDATFQYVKTRSVPKQQKPYPILSEVTKNQPTFEYSNIKGSLIGFWCPEYVGGVNVSGYHLHFLSDDKTKGGHLLDVRADQSSVYLDATDSFTMYLSSNKGAANISEIEKEIDKVEK